MKSFHIGYNVTDLFLLDAFKRSRLVSGKVYILLMHHDLFDLNKMRLESSVSRRTENFFYKQKLLQDKS